MLARISFYGNNDLTFDEIKDLSKNLSDNIEYDQLYKKENDKIEVKYYWETTDPNDPELANGNKKGLIEPLDLYRLSSNKEYIADIEILLSLHPGLKFNIRGIPKTIESNYSSVIENILNIQNKFENALKTFNKQVEFNQKCDVHIGNLGLLNVNQLGYASDICTESLQEIINSGWRIIAVCVQPDQRRPDYILGRYSEDSIGLKCVKF